MSWWDRRRRARRLDPFDVFDDEFFGSDSFGGRFFRDFDESIRQMREEMNRLYEKARSGELESPEKGGPYVYGWSFRMGPDGVPHLEEFGNIKGLATGTREGLPAGREPLVDVRETNDQVIVTAELPGVEKKDIDLETTEKNLGIRVDTENRSYYKNVELPTTVRAESAKAAYNNGVLEVVLDKTSPEVKGKKIKIE